MRFRVVLLTCGLVMTLAGTVQADVPASIQSTGRLCALISNRQVARITGLPHVSKEPIVVGGVGECVIDSWRGSKGTPTAFPIKIAHGAGAELSVEEDFVARCAPEEVSVCAQLVERKQHEASAAAAAPGVSKPFSVSAFGAAHLTALRGPTRDGGASAFAFWSNDPPAEHQGFVYLTLQESKRRPLLSDFKKAAAILLPASDWP